MSRLSANEHQLKDDSFDWKQIREEINKLVLQTGPRESVGIVGMEVYFPSEYVSQEELEQFDGVSKGKYSQGLGQRNMAVCDNSEDIVSMCMTAVESLLDKYGIDRKDIGRIEVGTETIADKSKSVKTFLMKPFNDAGCYDIHGIDTINACYGGTAALFNAINWIESSSWDGRFGIVVAGDIAIYERGPARPTGGAGVVAMLIGPHAPIKLETSHIATHMEHVYDFYKPHMSSEYPVVDGQLSNECYMRSIDQCYSSFKRLYEKANGSTFQILRDADFAILHAPYTKLVQKSYSRLAVSDATDEDLEQIKAKHGDFEALAIHQNKEVEKAVMQLYSQDYVTSVEPSLRLSRECGNMYTGSVYAGLCSLIDSRLVKRDMRSLVFSYGSGLASSLFSLKFTGNTEAIRRFMDLDSRLNARKKITPEEYTERLQEREYNYKSGFPISQDQGNNRKNLFPGTFFVKSIDSRGRREYARAFSTACRLMRFMK